ncbi:AMP-binding protein [Micromonospora sp. DR5-3]|uniref:AMP-binding protein n=1 Tax=unclassified Micromonospora TaxID=2617518 RepID=UPI0011DC41BF|nr:MULTISPECIES: AMP-binding protein [unclassified Micromonospora]MCW3815804.1 AMP-binding protein [Micromonospora sp. DR5-3]TYC21213.1 amino acid adenylation domain-containing protein [Micromonospora sp. MP36]
MLTELLVAPVRAVAAHTPSAPAIVDPDRTTSYGELVSMIDATADSLRRAGVRAGETLSLHAERHRDLPIMLLAAWTVGASVQLIDTTLPRMRIEQNERAVRPRWRLRRDGLSRLDDALPAHPECSHILMTSGSAGVPAAVAVSAAGLAGPMRWYLSEFTPRPDDRVALVSGLGHDPLLRDILVPLHSGGTLVIPPADVLRDPRAVAEFIDSTGISILHSTPALLELAMAGRPLRLDQLRLVVSGGAPLPVGLVRRLRGITDSVVVNAYGATETPQIASCFILGRGVVPDPALSDATTLGVGEGVAGAQLFLMDGEVVVRSRYLALGYVSPGGRADRFIDDPLAEPGYRAYRTGDRAVAGDRADGPRITGRLDRQISVNGLRIAPEEVEAAALGHPAVQQAHVAPYDGPAGTLVGLSVVLSEPVEPEVLRAFLRARLPSRAVPVTISILQSLALNHNHKVVGVPNVGVAE